LFAKHAEQFDELIYADYKELFERIAQWAQHKNYDIKKLAYATLDSYYKVLAENIKSKSGSNDEKETLKCKQMLKFFMKAFYSTVTSNKDMKEIIIAIKGYGIFTSVIKYSAQTIYETNMRII
jgi:hypothetical protein